MRHFRLDRRYIKDVLHGGDQHIYSVAPVQAFLPDEESQRLACRSGLGSLFGLGRVATPRVAARREQGGILRPSKAIRWGSKKVSLGEPQAR